MERSVPRVGARAGWLALVGIVGYHLALTALAGQRVSGTSDLATIKAYYGQSIVAVLGVSQFLVVIPFLVFAWALRETLARSPGGRLIAGVALLAAVAEVPVVLTEIASQAAVAAAVEAGEGVAGLFRFWDVLYNSGLYALEATWVLGFGLAIRHSAGFPRFMSWLSPLTGVLLAINVFAIWIRIPDAATLPSAVAISAWIAGASLGLRRLARTDALPVAVASAA
jgi:hypothetical protein